MMTEEERTAHYKEYRKRYNQLNKEKLRKQASDRYQRNKKKFRQYAKEYYRKNKPKIRAMTDFYRLTHRKQINEWSRNRYHSIRKRQSPEKVFSFYRDFVKELDLTPQTTVRTTIFSALLALPLTQRQKQLVSLTFAGHSQPEIAKQLGVHQTTICKTWNGQPYLPTNKMMGGIHNKFLKFLKDNPTFMAYLERLELKWSEEASHGKNSQKSGIPISNRRVSCR